MLKFSTSPRMFGVSEINDIISIEIIIIGSVSLTRNRGLNFTLSEFVAVTEGLEDPFS